MWNWLNTWLNSKRKKKDFSWKIPRFLSWFLKWRQKDISKANFHTTVFMSGLDGLLWKYAKDKHGLPEGYAKCSSWQTFGMGSKLTPFVHSRNMILQSFLLKALYLCFTVPGQQAVVKSPSTGKKDNSVSRHTSRMDLILSVSTLKEVWGNPYK